MKSKMLKLVTRPEKISAEAVDMLEHYLQRAKNGEITAVAIVAIEPNGSATHQATSSDHWVALLGAVTRLLHRMQLHADERTRDVV
jgi:hypothetical protein